MTYISNWNLECDCYSLGTYECTDTGDCTCKNGYKDSDCHECAVGYYNACTLANGCTDNSTLCKGKRSTSVHDHPVLNNIYGIFYF